MSKTSNNVYVLGRFIVEQISTQKREITGEMLVTGMIMRSIRKNHWRRIFFFLRRFSTSCSSSSSCSSASSSGKTITNEFLPCLKNLSLRNIFFSDPSCQLRELKLYLPRLSLHDWSPSTLPLLLLLLHAVANPFHIIGRDLFIWKRRCFHYRFLHVPELLVILGDPCGL